MSAIQWLTGCVCIMALLFFVGSLNDDECSVDFCRTLFMFFILSFMFWAVSVGMKL